METTFQSSQNQDIYIYGYVTYDKSKLKGPQLQNVKSYTIQTHCKIPITENEFLDIVLNTVKENDPVDSHIVYTRTFTGKKNTPLEQRFNKPISRIMIGTDIGSNKDLSHIAVKIFGINDEKVFDAIIEQEEEFRNYESALNAVFMQVEKLSNPLVGAQYWLSPTQIFPERVKRLAELKEQSNILTSLSILARAINIRIYEETRSGIIIDEAKFWEIANSHIQIVKENEKELVGHLDISEINYQNVH
jgi:hypothetical protein